MECNIEDLVFIDIALIQHHPTPSPPAYEIYLSPSTLNSRKDGRTYQGFLASNYPYSDKRTLP